MRRWRERSCCLSSRSRQTRVQGDWSSDVCSSDLDDPTDCKSSHFLRTYAQAVPYPKEDPLAPYGALARDGISCTACHRMLPGEGPENPAMEQPQNRCLKERQELLNPDTRGFAKTFTGSFLVGP